MTDDEKVLCVSRHAVETMLSVPGDPESRLAFLLASKTYRNRKTPNGNDPDVEHDARYKQLIPYIVCVNKDGQILAYNRGSKGGEKRLASKWAIGFGGHVNDQDATFKDGIIREIREELSGLDVDVLAWAHPDDDDDRGLIHGPIGFLNDDSDAVGRVHLGVVYVLRADEVVPKENPEWQWIRLPETPLDEACLTEFYESWARLALPMVRAWMESEGK